MFAGAFDPGAAAPLRLRLPALAREQRRGVLCLLDGVLDEREELAHELGLETSAPACAVLGAGYRRWRQELPARLRGDFAFVIWDAEREEGLIARDQLGVRCVYLADRAGALCFASELHLLLDLLPATPPPARAGVAHWIAASARPGGATLFEGVRRLAPGSLLAFGRREGVGRERPYWRLRYREPTARSVEECAHEVRVGLDRAVARRLHGVERAGVLMSGGLDSASVAAVASGARGGGELRAYAGVFPAYPGVDESELIGLLRGELGLAGIDARVGSGGLLDSALSAAAVWRLPLLGWGDAWTLPLLRAAAEDGVTLTLGGDGGDELFGVRAQLLADLLRGAHPLRALALARRLPGAPPSARAAARVLARHALPDAAPPRLLELGARAGRGRELPSWLLGSTARALLESDDPHAWMRLDGPRWWAYAAHGLTCGLEERGIFEHQRLRAAGVGLVARHPLLDLDLVELVLALPPRASFDAELNRPLLRRAIAGRLPDAVRLRARKAWFDALILDSLCVADAAGVRALLTGPRTELGAYVDLDGVRAMLDSGPPEGAGRFRWMHLLWRLVTAECWLRTLAGGLPEIPLSHAAVELEHVGGGDRRVIPFSTSTTPLGDLR
jgi:asparagine synthase (glutamine-hydrolysing)